jgi:PAT family beta-lactamase induction signal transducer AmpG
VIASVLGALAGGVLTTRWGLFPALWALGLLQAFSNLGYALVAYMDAGRAAIYVASLFESFSGGLGTAAFLAFLMHICDKRQAATEYALLSATFAATGWLVGSVSGVGTTQLGYGNYFLLTFAMAFPAYALLPWVRRWIRDVA